MRDRLLLLVLAVGCATSDPDVTDEGVGFDVVSKIPAALEIAACPVGQWCIEAPPTLPTEAALPLLHGVWAVSADEVFAVGDHGTILHRSNSTWTAMSSGTTNNLRGVWAANSSDVWAVGVGGTVLRFNGTAWSAVAARASDVDAVWGSSATDVWLAGSGVVTHWNGTTFSSTNFGGTLLSVSGTGPTDVWVTGENTYLHHFTGTWATVNPGAGTSTLFAVFAVGTNDVWATDYIPGKETMHFNGVKWVAQKTGSGIFDGLSARAPNDIWGAGESRVGHWNGSAWTTTQPFGSNVSLWSVTIAAGNLWIVGDSALIAHQAF